jgi:hypothetical protein
MDKLTKGQYYKVQVALSNNNIIGTFSDVGICKYLYDTEVVIDELEGNISSLSKFHFTGHYISNQDASEKVYKYKFDLYDNNKMLIISTDWTLHNSANDTIPTESINQWYSPNVLTENQKYYI